MDEADLTSLERESMVVWPCLREEMLGGWLLRFGGGVYGRSDSVQPYGDPGCDLDAAIKVCEEAYRRENRRAMFRISEFGSWSTLDSHLEDLGYQVIGRTNVMVGPVLHASSDDAVEHFGETDPAWLSSFFALKQTAAGLESATTALLQRLGPSRRFAQIVIDQTPAAVGFGATHNRTLWVFGMATHVSRRRQGLAERLIRSLMAWANKEGCYRTALQVTVSNDPAHALYEKLGFVDAYRYHYRSSRAEQ